MSLLIVILLVHAATAVLIVGTLGIKVRPEKEVIRSRSATTTDQDASSEEEAKQPEGQRAPDGRVEANFEREPNSETAGPRPDLGASFEVPVDLPPLEPVELKTEPLPLDAPPMKADPMPPVEAVTSPAPGPGESQAVGEGADLAAAPSRAEQDAVKHAEFWSEPLLPARAGSGGEPEATPPPDDQAPVESPWGQVTSAPATESAGRPPASDMPIAPAEPLSQQVPNESTIEAPTPATAGQTPAPEMGRDSIAAPGQEDNGRPVPSALERGPLTPSGSPPESDRAAPDSPEIKAESPPEPAWGAGSATASTERTRPKEPPLSGLPPRTAPGAAPFFDLDAKPEDPTATSTPSGDVDGMAEAAASTTTSKDLEAKLQDLLKPKAPPSRGTESLRSAGASPTSAYEAASRVEPVRRPVETFVPEVIPSVKMSRWKGGTSLGVGRSVTRLILALMLFSVVLSLLSLIAISWLGAVMREIAG